MARSLQVSTVKVHYHDKMFDHIILHIVKNLDESEFLVSFDKFINSEIQNISCILLKFSHKSPIDRTIIY